MSTLAGFIENTKASINLLLGRVCTPIQYLFPDFTCWGILAAKEEQRNDWFLQRNLYFFVMSLVVMSILICVVYIAELVQAKTRELQLNTLRKYKQKSLEQLAIFDRERASLQHALKLVQNATMEHNLLLYIASRQKHQI